jgi:hypothetical protein
MKSKLSNVPKKHNDTLFEEIGDTVRQFTAALRRGILAMISKVQTLKSLLETENRMKLRKI